MSTDVGALAEGKDPTAVTAGSLTDGTVVTVAPRIPSRRCSPP